MIRMVQDWVYNDKAFHLAGRRQFDVAATASLVGTEIKKEEKPIRNEAYIRFEQKVQD